MEAHARRCRMAHSSRCLSLAKTESKRWKSCYRTIIIGPIPGAGLIFVNIAHGAVATLLGLSYKRAVRSNGASAS
jgi:hypothetical protein